MPATLGVGRSVTRMQPEGEKKELHSVPSWWYTQACHPAGMPWPVALAFGGPPSLETGQGRPILRRAGPRNRANTLPAAFMGDQQLNPCRNRVSLGAAVLVAWWLGVWQDRGQLQAPAASRRSWRLGDAQVEGQGSESFFEGSPFLRRGQARPQLRNTPEAAVRVDVALRGHWLLFLGPCPPTPIS